MKGVGKWLWMMTVLATWVEVNGCLEQEKAALLQLKQNLGDQFPLDLRFVLLTSWKEGKTSNCCGDWEGVTCGLNYRVVSLSVLPPEYFNYLLKVHFNASVLHPFEELRELNLTDFNIKSWDEDKGAPKLSSKLKSLELLNLQYNSFDVSSLSQLRGFSSLKYLILDGNNLEGLQLHDIEAISQNLEELSLGGTEITSFRNNNGSTKLSSSLKVLDLGGNNLDNNIISQLSGFPSLHTLNLGANQLRGNVPINALHQLRNLEVLDLSENNIIGVSNYNGSTKLSSSLKVLDLSYNKLDKNIISQLSGFQSLHTLNLEGNNLRGIVPLEALHQLKNLEELDLSHNLITGITNCNGSTNLSSSLKILDLSYNELDNNIISQLSGFQSLHTLNLRGIQLRGNVPINALHQLRNLEVLDLSGNEISGLTNYNATFSGGQTSLQELDLSGNQLAGGIPTCLQNLTSLETLDLSFNELIGNIGSSPLIHLLSLKYLILSYNHLLIPHSFQSFANHTKLEYFFGDFNQVVHEVSKHDAQPPFPLGPQLQALSLSNCALFTYPPFLRHQRELRFVDLSDNLLQGEFPTWLIENNLKLDTLFLSNNSFIGSLQLPSVVHANISRVWVAKNKIQGHIPANIGVIYPNLVELDLSYNKFKGNIPLSLVDLHSLKGLYLSNNLLSGEIHHLINSLESLDLSNNAFEGELPFFNGLLFLRFLNLQGNKYSRGLQKNKFGPSLEFLNLSNNSLEGPMPKDIYNSSQLIVLDLSFNRLDGLLPKFFSSDMDILKLNNNRLSGHVTDAFCNSFSSLSLLDLSNNDLKGRIPAAISNLTQLRALFLRGNQFIGQIPFQLCLVELSLLDLSSNNLYGPIPTCLSQSFTVGFSFEILNTDIGKDFELINDSIVGELISMKLDSAHNPFHNKVEFVTKNMDYNYEGSILDYMSGIDLSCNKLTGHIPHELGNWSNIQALNLSHNQLWGVIPSTFSNLKNIESLDLSYNHLNGRIPAEVTNLDTLEVFNVSYNNLSGRIPLQGHSLTFDDTSYKGNPSLCGRPLPINCTTDDNTPSTSTSESQDEGSGWIDMEAFYITFAGSGVTMFLAVVIVMLINPHWWNAWFYLAKACILSCYYFFEDIIRKLRGAKRV